MPQYGGNLVTSQGSHVELYRAEFNRLYEDASYSAQTYYEASKGAEFLGRAIVYVPALLASVSSLLIILGLSKDWGAVGIASGIVSATSSFLGTERKAAAFRHSGNSFTKLRHEARLWRDTLVETRPETEAIDALKKLRSDYNEVVEVIELPGNHFFKKASRRITKNVLQYSGSTWVSRSPETGASDGKAALPN
jgi:hypothetical protein